MFGHHTPYTAQSIHEGGMGLPLSVYGWKNNITSISSEMVKPEDLAEKKKKEKKIFRGRTHF